MMQTVVKIVFKYRPLPSILFPKTNGFSVQCRSYSPRAFIAPYLLDRTRPAEEILKNLTPDDAQRLEYIKAEHNMLISTGRPAPLNLSALDYLELLCCASVSARNRYYMFRFKISKKKDARKAKMMAKTENEV